MWPKPTPVFVGPYSALALSPARDAAGVWEALHPRVAASLRGTMDRYLLRCPLVLRSPVLLLQVLRLVLRQPQLVG